MPAYDPITGDDKEAAKWMRKLNKDAREGQVPFDFSNAKPWERLGNLPAAIAKLETLDDETPEALANKEKLYRQIVEGSGYENARLLHDAWCAAFVWPKHSREYGTELTTEQLRKIERNPYSVVPSLKANVREIAFQYRFFHWYLEFPAVFGSDGQGGFDVVLGNPPWERVKLQEKEWFAECSPEIANAPNAAARKRLIARLTTDNPRLLAEFQMAQRLSEGESHLLRNSGLYPLCGRGDINLYAVFAEGMRRLLSPDGRVGCVLPTGIGTDDTTKFFFQDVVDKKSLVSFFDFENKEGLFPGVHREQKFCLFTAGGGKTPTVDVAEFVFFAHTLENLEDPDRRFALSADDIARLNPNTRTCPIFRSRHDAEVTRLIYRSLPVLIKDGPPEENPWCIEFLRMLDMANDSHLFCTREQLERQNLTLNGNVFAAKAGTYSPLYEGKLTDIYNHRFATFEGVEAEEIRKGNPREASISEFQTSELLVIPRFWVPADAVEKAGENGRSFALSFHRVANPNNERSALFSILPRAGVGDSLFIIAGVSPLDALSLCGIGNAFVFDFVVRQKVGSRNFSFFIVKQIAVLPPSVFAKSCPWTVGLQTVRDWMWPRVLELTYAAWDLEPFAQDCGFDGPPFRWDEERRFQLRCELDAAFFHLYLGSDEEWRRQPESLTKYFSTPRDAVAYIMDTFPIVKRKDEEKFGTYRTKDTILKIYDAMQESIRSGQPYQSRLDPPPADAACRHPKLKLGILAYGSLITDPGPGIAPKIKFRIKTVTPFPVEYGRYSGKTRGGAPTVVKHDKGAPVAAEILVLDGDVSFGNARDMLWRRERHKEGSGEAYAEGKSPNSVLVLEVTDNPCVERILYTDFMPEGKISNPQPEELAKRAIRSVREANEGKDGITYLMANLASGIKTPLTEAYKMQILKHTQTESLEEALNNVRSNGD